MLIGFAGRAQTGKTSAAQTLALHRGFRTVSFASGLKEEVTQMLEKFGIDFRMANLYGDNDAKQEVLTFHGCRRPLQEMPEWLDFIHQQSPKNLNTNSLSFTGRQILQWWGTNFRRAQLETYWIDKAGARIQGLLDEGFSVAIDDIRFPDEAILIKKLGGRVFCIDRDERPEVAGSEHPSETALDHFAGFDGYVLNNDTLRRYEQKILAICDEK
jgi:hypothetical protein